MKIGIISEFNRETVNYGNNLQAYALNRYIRMIGDFDAVDTLYFPDPLKKKHLTAPVRYAGTYVLRKTRNLLRNLAHGYIHRKPSVIEQVAIRQEAFHSFQESRMNIRREDMNWKTLKDSDYDIFIIGSDMVWGQFKYFVSRVKFLDFKASKTFKKIAYAASIGDNWIPKCNERYLRKCLADFDAISVREASAVPLLESIGVKGAVHALDPTLLLSTEEWEEIESRPEEISDSPYVFVYLLGTYASQRKAITEWARRKKLTVVVIPNAIGGEIDADRAFGDIRITDCNPEEWIWLIHHAEYVITDSFHAVVFSTIFKRRFFAMSREFSVDINIRLTDYLDTIGQPDKMVSEEELLSGKEYQWDYELVERILEERRSKSERFLGEALEC